MHEQRVTTIVFTFLSGAAIFSVPLVVCCRSNSSTTSGQS